MKRGEREGDETIRRRVVVVATTVIFYEYYA